MKFVGKLILKRRVERELSLNKGQIMKILKDFPIDRSSYYLIMGSALVLYGIRNETNDIDIGCTKEVFNSLLENGYQAIESRSGLEKIIYSQDISIYKEWKVNEVMFLEGIPVADLKSILNDKIRFGRKKDVEDIIKIKELLKSQQ